MDSEKFSEKMIWLDEEMNELSGELYGATQDALPASELQLIVDRAGKLLAEYQSLKQALDGGKLEELTGYESDMDRISGYLQTLREG